MKEIIFVAVIFFCNNNDCGVISPTIPYKNLNSCKAEVNAMIDKLRSEGASKIEGRCLDVEVNRYI